MNGDRHVIDEELKALLEDPVQLFLTNREAMKKALPWQGAMTHCLCALLCAPHAMRLDTQRLLDMRKLVRERTGLFSPFRGLPILPLATLLTGSLMPEDDLERVLRLYQTLRDAGFTPSPYLAETAFLPLLMTQAFDAGACAAAAKDMLRQQRRARPFLDAQTTCMYAMLSAIAGNEPESAHIETELGFHLLKTVFPPAGTTYALARVLTLGEGETEKKCERVTALYEGLRTQGIHYGRFYELPALGVLSLMPVGLEELIRGIADMDARLRAEKGFSAWSLQSAQRVLYAASLYAVTLDSERQEAWLQQGLLQSVAGVLIAAQAAACAGASAAAASSAAASS